MKGLFIAILFLASIKSFGQAYTRDAGSAVRWRDTALLPHATSAASTAMIDISRAPYSIAAGGDASAACQAAVDSLWNTYRGGTVIVPYNYNWPRPVGGSQKGVIMRPNISILGFGNTLTMTGNCPWFTTDFRTDSLGTTITANTDSSNTNITVASSAGYVVGDTVFGRFGTAPYDAAEPNVFGWFIITVIPDGTHITLNKPCGANLTVAGTSTLNKRLIRVHNLVTNARVSGFNLVSTQSGGNLAEAGCYFQGGWNLQVDHITATNPGAGLVVYQFCLNSRVEFFHVKGNISAGNGSWGRGLSIQESPGTIIRDGIIEGYEINAIVNEANNPGSLITNVRINNTYTNATRTAIISLGSGEIRADNVTFGGYAHQIYDQSQAFGNLILTNTTIEKGTPATVYEQQGVTVMPFWTMGDSRYYLRKRYSKRMLLPNNSSYAFDSLPKGLIVDAQVMAEDTTGITECYFRRDNSFTNNGTDFRTQLIPKQAIRPSIGDGFNLGTGIASNKLNYNDDKGFVVTRNATGPANKYIIVTITYLENNSGAKLRTNGVDYDGYFDRSPQTGTGSVVLDNAAILTNPVVGTQTAGDNSTKAASTAYADAGTQKRSANISGSTNSSSGSVSLFTTPNDAVNHVYRLSARATITAISVATLTVTATYTDENSTSRTVTFYPMGSTTAALSVTGVSNFPVMGEIIIKANTTITVSYAFSGTSISYNYSANLVRVDY